MLPHISSEMEREGGEQYCHLLKRIIGDPTMVNPQAATLLSDMLGLGSCSRGRSLLERIILAQQQQQEQRLKEHVDLENEETDEESRNNEAEDDEMVSATSLSNSFLALTIDAK